MDSSKDVEQGANEDEDNLQPLLGVSSDTNSRLKNSRPFTLPLLNTGNTPYECNDGPALAALESPSTCSTANNTPLAETLENCPKKWRRSDRRLRRLNTELLEAIENHNDEEIERLLKAGANANATCRLGLVSACHTAALAGGDALSLLVKFGAEKHRQDKLGRTPLHLAAWAGNARQMAILLDFPEDVLNRVDSDSLSSDAEEDVKKLISQTRDLANTRCDLGVVKTLLPKTWKDNIDHNCRDIVGTLPLLQPGWTPLHVASACCRKHCTRILLAAGADPNICDVSGRTPLDVAGFGYYYNENITAENFTEVISMLIDAGGTYNTMKVHGINNLDTPLHTAVELENLDATNALLKAGASITCLNVAGQTPLHVCVKKKLEKPLQILANHGTNDADPLAAMVDVKDRDGHTVLQAAVEAEWVPGVCIALEAGADVTLKANDGDTPVHSAAALGNEDVLNEILSVAKQRVSIDCQNNVGETPLFKAIINGHLECVKSLLYEGASYKIRLPGEVTILHVAAEHGWLELLRFLLEFDESISNMINLLTAEEKRGFGAIHFAVSNNHIECVELLLSKNADIRLRTTSNPHKLATPLHIAAIKNYKDVAKILLKFDKTTLHEVNGMGWFPIHTAGHHGSRDVCMLLLKEGADLSCYTDGPKKYRRTAIDMIINNLSKPAEFLEEVFDSCIVANSVNMQDVNCEITVDYRILMPSVCDTEQMKVVQALLKTGNRYGQKRLLVHPLVQSFLFLKWKALLPFFYTIILMYGLFVVSLTIFAVSVFFYKDTEDSPPVWLAPNIWGYVVYTTICLLLIQEVLYMNVKSSRYFLQLETWVKFGSLCLASILPPAVLVTAWSQDDWPRHVATVALLLSWLELMFLLSRFPNGGYYVLMFGKVASNVVKILLTFAFLVIGFSLSFMIQFHSQIPFESPWAALVKTIVMMTSEFDYVALFDEEHAKQLSRSLIIIRIIFVVFLILAAIVLMNLMVGVAVNDINDLEILGNIRRLAKQAEFLGTLDILVYNRIFRTILPKKVNDRIKNKRKVIGVLSLCPGKPRWRHYKMLPSRLRDDIMDKAMEQKKMMDYEDDMRTFQKKIDEMHEAIVLKKSDVDQLALGNVGDESLRGRLRHDEVMKHLGGIDNGMAEMKEQITSCVQDNKSPIEEVNVKIHQMFTEIKEIKLFLSKLESRLGMVR